MLPPGLGFNAVSDKALAAAKSSKMPKAYWDWEPMLKNMASGFFPHARDQSAVRNARSAGDAA